MAYAGFLDNINNKFNLLFQEISVEYNFDYGDEFEIAFCKVMRTLLPNKYGVCRGFVVTREGKIKGDDIIIYDQDRFPTLRLLEDNTFAQKQKIPVEAVYAYIEAKHTLYLDDSGGQSLSKALSQVMSVKTLQRETVPFNQVTPQILIKNLSSSRPTGWPNYHNPIYGAIISRHVKLREQDSSSDVHTFFPYLESYCHEISTNRNAPDLIIAGSNSLALPAVQTQIDSPFFIEGTSRLDSFKSDGQAFATGMVSMMYALDYIMLGKIHWPTILASGLNLTLNMEEKI